MSFVSIPALVGPMLGPVVGGFIVAYFHWRMIFFVNLPIGLVGLYLVHRHLPDHRAERVDPLDVGGLLLFGSGVGLLSYVLEVFGEHTLTAGEIAALLALSLVLLGCYFRHALAAAHPLLRLDLFRIRTFRVGGQRQLHHAARRRRHSVSLAAPLPGGHGVLAGPFRPLADASVARRDRPQDDDAAHPDEVRVPDRAPGQHHTHGRARSRSSPPSGPALPSSSS